MGYAKDGSLPDPASTDNAEFKCILQLLKDSIPADKTKYTRMAKACHGVSEETTTGIHPLSCLAPSPTRCLDNLTCSRTGRRIRVTRTMSTFCQRSWTRKLPASTFPPWAPN